MFEAAKLKTDFPILSRKINGKPLAYLDSAATAQKPQAVIDAVSSFYAEHNANAHRGINTLAEEATEIYEGARQAVARFINAADSREVIITHGTTESLNLVANSYAHAHLKTGDAIVLTEMEHHANIVPWYLAGEHHNIEIRFARVGDDGRIDRQDLATQLKGAKLLSLTHISNVLGTINPIEEIAGLAHQAGAVVVVDAAQSVPHQPVDVQALGADFVAFSGHKMLGPTAIGVLWGKSELLHELRPFLGGGQMIREVDYGEIIYADPPYRFEAGTMPLAEAAGLTAAIGYLDALGMENVRAHGQRLVSEALERLGKIPGLEILGPPDPEARGGLIAFTLGDIHPHDLATIVDQQGVSIRSGHHCTQPLHRKLGIPASARASFSVYNTTDDIDRLVDGLEKARKVFV